MGKTVKVHDEGRDKYGRTLGRVEIDGQNVNRQMIADGLAWHYTRYRKDSRLAAAEQATRAARRRVWADPTPLPPWEGQRRSRGGIG